jgi:hypothetical protein
MTKSVEQDALEGSGTLAAMVSTPLVLVFALAAGLARQSWWVVLLVGWAGQVLSGFVAGGVAVLLRPVSRQVGQKAQIVLMAFAVLVGVAVCVTAMVLAWMNWA